MEKRPITTDNNPRNRRVVICGATGFLGSYLVAQLLQDDYIDIHIISRSTDGCKLVESVVDGYGLMSRYLERVNVHYGEIANYQWLIEVINGAQLLFNCASIVDISSKNNDYIIADNTQLTYLIAEAAKECGVQRVIHISSIAALDVQQYPTLTNETHKIQEIGTKSNYAKSKFYSENEMWQLHYSGIDVTVVKPAVVLGSAMGAKARSSSAIVERLGKGISFYTSGVMGYVMARDVARAMVFVSDKNEAVGESYILCSDNLSYKELITKIARSRGKRAPFISVPNWIIRAAGACSEFLQRLGVKSNFSSSMADNLTSKYLYDGSKITTLGFDYLDIDKEI